jgi:hypothetical protein
MAAYPYAFVLHGRTAFLVWLDDEQGGADDRVKLDDHGALLTFDDLPALIEACRSEGIVLADEDPSGPLDLDLLRAWIDTGGEADPRLLLNGWNLFGDVARSVGVLLEDRSPDRDTLYNKLFFANNLPAVTPPGERYDPHWSEAELAGLREVVGEGLRVFRLALVHHA